MKKSIELAFLVFVLLTVLLSGCAPAPTPVPPTFTPSPIPSTFTPEATATPTLTLECSLVKVDIQQSLPANVYGAMGEFVGSGKPEIAALQIDIIGESGEITSQGNVTTEIDYHGNLSVKIDDERTYPDSKNIYKIIGTIVYKISDLETLSSYEITVSGGGFGTTSQTCKNP